MTLAGLTAEAVVRLLGLAPHPEGGFFRETFRDDAHHEGRSHSTAIYYLLAAGDVSRWHRVDAAEIWHFYAGAPLTLRLAERAGGPVAEHRLGPDIASGETPQIAVPRGQWQSAESRGAWTLCGCTVAPGFHFAGFELAPAGFDPR